MAQHKLWAQLAEWKTDCEWVDLTHALSPTTPHWVGWPALEVKEMASLDSSLFSAHAYNVVGQYGTHVDAPSHMVKGARSLDEVALTEMVLPLCVVDCTAACDIDCDYVMGVDDILAFEAQHGKIPAGAFVVMKSGWCTRSGEAFDNCDEAGDRHFPGWGLAAVKFLVEERNIGGIGHETSDTEAPITSGKTNYEVEYYILAQDRIQIELLANVAALPPVGALIFCTFPKVQGGTGYPARCFALCPKNT